MKFKHNRNELSRFHPSGEPAPSLGDIHISKLLKRAGEILRIALLDHIIIGDATYVSLKERKML